MVTQTSSAVIKGNILTEIHTYCHSLILLHTTAVTYYLIVLEHMHYLNDRYPLSFMFCIALSTHVVTLTRWKWNLLVYVCFCRWARRRLQCVPTYQPIWISCRYYFFLFSGMPSSILRSVRFFVKKFFILQFLYFHYFLFFTF